MAALERALAQPDRSLPRSTDDHTWLRLYLAAVMISGLIAVQEDPPLPRFDSAVSTGQNGHDRWASPGPRWRSRSQILEDAGILRHR
jgi:hypothetical protein